MKRLLVLLPLVLLLSACNPVAAWEALWSDPVAVVENCSGTTFVDGQPVNYNVKPGSTTHYGLDTATKIRTLKVVCGEDGELVGAPTLTVRDMVSVTNSDAPVVASNGRPSADAGINLADYMRLTGVPTEAKAYLWADGFFNENVCGLPWGLDFCGNPGVEETHNPDDKNPSAQFISPDSQESLESATGEKDVPQDGYMRVTGAYFTAKFTNGISFTALENDDTEVILYVRGLNSTGPGNFNVKTVFSGYNPGATTVTVYDIPKGANGFMGETGIRKTVANSHLRNCGDGCQDTLLVFLDLNNGAWSAFFSEDGGDLQFAGSNVVPPDGVR